MRLLQNLSIALFRLGRIMTGKKGVYGTLGKGNHFAQGVLVYENALIGNHNYFAPYCMVNNAQIGNYCSIGPGCRLGLGEHDMTAISTLPAIGNGAGNMELFDKNRPTKLGCDVWLGANVVVKQGVSIGHGAVIGAGAVVAHDVPPYGIAIGVPAKLTGYRFNEEQQEKLLCSQWFLEDMPRAKKLAAKLQKSFQDKAEDQSK